jgi:amino acid adenylation domain-containing protein
MKSTEQWEKKSSIRNRPQRVLGNKEAQYFFPALEQALCFHPRIIALGDDAKRFILIQSAYVFMKTIFINETEVISNITNKIISGESNINFSRETQQNLLLIIIDESYHAYVANDFILQVSSLTAIEPLRFARSSGLSYALDEIRKTVPQEYKIIFEIIAACIAENSITKELISIARDPLVDPLFYELNDDHIVDEARHGKIFTELLYDLWQEISPAARDIVGPVLPAFIKKYLSRDIAIQNDKIILSKLQLRPDEIDNIIHDTHPNYYNNNSLHLNPIVKNITALLQKSGLLKHEGTARAFQSFFDGGNSHTQKNNSHLCHELPLVSKKQAFLNKSSVEHSVMALFQQQVAKNPQGLAIVDGDYQISYQELSNMADAVTSRLRKLGLKRGAIIAVLHEHGYEYVALILGIMKAGMVFMPLPHDGPLPRLRKILQEAEAELIVVDKADKINHLEQLGLLNFVLTSQQVLETPREGDTSELHVLPHELAYIIYTSGSSGEPKGVMISHGSLANFAQSAVKSFPIKQHDRVLQFAPYCFDPSLAEITASLIAGASLCIRSKNILDSSQHFFLECKRLHISLLNLPTSLWYQLIRDVDSLQELLPSSLKTIVIGGEALRPHHLDHWYKQVKSPIRLLNTYGPSECTIAVTACDMAVHQALRSRESLIGSSFAGASLYVLDEHLRLLPHGSVGELYVGGPGLSLGYFKRPDLNKERFLYLPDISSSGPLYKTGDRVKYVKDEDGQQILAFIGRADKQVKIRGFRVELGEIEHVINSYHGVISSRVLYDKYLAAFIVADPIVNISIEDLRAKIKNLLPDYMQPSKINIIEELPITKHGKIDDENLLSLLNTNSKNNTFVEDIESRLAKIWENLLATKEISPDSHFFYLGGHSLLAMRLLAQINHDFKSPVTLREILESPRFSDMAQLIKKSLGQTTKAPAPLSFAQESLWVEDQLQNRRSINYNIAYALHFKDDPSLDYTLLEKSLNHILERHSILRSVFYKKEHRLVQLAREKIVRLEPESLSLSEFKTRALAEARTAFDLAHEPPLRINLFRIAHDYHILLINHHHIIHDGYSIGLFLNELGICYEAYLKGNDPNLPLLSMHYEDYANWQRKNAQELWSASLEYWLKKLANYSPLQLPYRKHYGKINPSQGERYRFSLQSSTVHALRMLCHEENCTLFIGVLAIFYVLFSRDSAKSDIAIATIMSTREYQNDANIFGVFINIVILRQEIKSTQPIKLLLQELKKTFIEASSHRFVPLENISKKITMNRLPHDNSLFDIMIIFHNRDQNLSKFDSPNLKANIEFIDNKTSKFGLTFNVFENQETLDIEIEYCPELYTASSVEGIAQRFLNLTNNNYI